MDPGAVSFVNFLLKAHLYIVSGKIYNLIDAGINVFFTEKIPSSRGVGRNRSSPLTEIVEVASPGAGGDYHTTYYPIPMFISHRIYAVQSNHKR